MTKTEAVVIECSPQMIKCLNALVETGLFGPSRDTAAQRLLEMKLYEMSMDTMRMQLPSPGSGKEESPDGP